MSITSQKIEGTGDETIVTVHLDDGTYTGQLKNNKREGTGVYKWNNGDVYCGEYQDNKKSGTFYDSCEILKEDQVEKLSANRLTYHLFLFFFLIFFSLYIFSCEIAKF